MKRGTSVRGWPLERSLREKEFIKILFLPTPDQPIGASITGKATERMMRN